MSSGVSDVQPGSWASGQRPLSQLRGLRSLDGESPVVDQEPQHAELEHTWSDAKGWLAALKTVDPARIGRRYIVTALVFFLLGGIAALAMRWQLSRPENSAI